MAAVLPPLPAALSPSRLQDFHACPRRYQYAAVERRPQPATFATVKGRVVHHVLEHLVREEPAARTSSAAAALVPAAEDAVVDEGVRADLGFDDDLRARLRREVDEAVAGYLAMEDPRDVRAEGVELRLSAAVDGAPILGILDRLDRDADGRLTIVDYKTGSVPSRTWDRYTFANTELYAALCQAALGELPTTIRLLYVSQRAEATRPVTEVVIRARAAAASHAWHAIGEYHERGDFPARPSASTCRFCAYRADCLAQGIAVPPPPTARATTL